jgi:hypothetical protein
LLLSTPPPTTAALRRCNARAWQRRLQRRPQHLHPLLVSLGFLS